MSKKVIQQCFQPILPLVSATLYLLRDAVTELGSVANISEVFVGFQQYLYSQDVAA
jgi:type I restriction enzyme, R subunit